MCVRTCVLVQVRVCAFGCCFVSANGLLVDVGQCCCLLMFVCLPLSRHFHCCKTWWIKNQHLNLNLNFNSVSAELVYCDPPEHPRQNLTALTLWASQNTHTALNSEVPSTGHDLQWCMLTEPIISVYCASSSQYKCDNELTSDRCPRHSRWSAEC